MALSPTPAPQKFSPLDVAGMLFNKGKLADARQRCNQILKTQPDNHQAILLLAMIEGRYGDFTKAIDLARHAIRLKPGYVDAFINLGILYRDRHAYSLAEKFITQGLQIEPNHRLGLLVLATLKQGKQDWPSAEQALRRLLLLEPLEAEFHCRLGDLLKRQGRNSEAADAFREALAIKPNFIKALFGLSQAHGFSANDPHLEMLVNCLADTKLSIKDRVLLNFALGWAHDQIGAYKEAFGYLSEANRLQAISSPFDEKEHLRYLSRIRAGYCEHEPRPSIPDTVSNQVPIFLIGPSRSGKTLCESLLAMDKRVRPLGEGKEFLLAMDEVIARHNLKDSYPECLGRLTSDQLKEMGSAYRRRIAVIDNISNFSINTLPGHYKFVGLILEALPEAKIIFCRRGTLDNCLRIYFTRFHQPHPYSHNLGTLARYYAAYWQQLAFWRKRYGARILQLRYEDLVTDPQVTITALLDYIGMDSLTSLEGLKIVPDEVGHWRYYANELQPMRETLHQMALVYELPDLLTPEDLDINPSPRSVLAL